MATSQAYLDVVGDADVVQWPSVYIGVINHACSRCGAQPYEMCTNPHTMQPSKMPCLTRMAV